MISPFVSQIRSELNSSGGGKGATATAQIPSDFSKEAGLKDVIHTQRVNDLIKEV